MVPKSPSLSLTLGAVSGVLHCCREHEGQILLFPIGSRGQPSRRDDVREVVVVDEVQEADRFVERVAGIDVGKSELKVCVRLPGDTPGLRREVAPSVVELEVAVPRLMPALR